MKYLNLFSLLFFIVASNAFSQSFDNWRWLNPKPTSNPIRCIEKLDDSFIGLGDHGTLIYSNNPSSGWNAFPTPFKDGFKSMVKFTSKSVIAVGDNGLLAYIEQKSSDKFVIGVIDLKVKDNFKEIASNGTGATGFIAADNGNIYQLTLVGDQLSYTVKKVGSSSINSVFFQDIATGWCVNNDGQIFKTTNAGKDWNLQTSPATKQLNKISFLNDKDGIAVGKEGLILLTSDGGAIWNVAKSSSLSDLYWGKIVSKDSIIVSGDVGACLFSSNGGANWTSLNTGIVPAITAFYCNNSQMIAAGQNGEILFNDKNNSWKAAHSRTTAYNLSDINFFNSKIGWLCGTNSTILNTKDGGNTWSKQSISYNGDFNTICFPTESNGFVGCGSGEMYSTTNSGSTWSKVNLNLNHKTITKIYFLNKNIGYFCGDKGYLYKTTNSGKNWNSVIVPSKNKLNSIKFMNDSLGCIVADGGEIFYSDDSGESWFKATNTNTTTNIVDVAFLNAQTLFAIGSKGLVLKSSNSGKSWETVKSFTDNDLNFVYFNSKTNSGFIGGQKGVFFTTKDGGNTWTSTELNTTNNIIGYGVNAGSELNAWLVGELGMIRYYNSSTSDVSEETIKANDNKLGVYPNPAKNDIFFNASSLTPSNNVAANIYAIDGSSVNITLNADQISGQAPINVSFLRTGKYLISFELNGALINASFIKE
jgi:photosystem II stability/assembly factor-like uncharacterized protein